MGGEPAHFGTRLDDFHQQMAARLASFPWSMSASTTHDTKRSEDVRARINVLSELPAEWAASVRSWSELTLRHKGTVQGVGEVPLANEEYFIYQTLVGIWPLNLTGPAPAELIQRVTAYVLKAAKESKLYTSWTEPNEQYEKALLRYVEAIMVDEKFLGAFLPLQEHVSDCGRWNALAQLVLKLTLPGVPDIYQGTELWSFSLVDPDNRRPVDYAARRKTLKQLQQTTAGGPAAITELIKTLAARNDEESGALKLLLTSTLLRYRRDNKDLFSFGTYLPFTASGPRAQNVVGFMRAFQSKSVLVLSGMHHLFFNYYYYYFYFCMSVFV